MVTNSKVLRRFRFALAITMAFFCLVAVSNASQKDVPLEVDGGPVILQTKVSGTAATAHVNINTATAEQLTTLPGVGPALAERIIRYRTETGEFDAPADLVAVKGVGPKKLDKIIDLIVVE